MRPVCVKRAGRRGRAPQVRAKVAACLMGLQNYNLDWSPNATIFMTERVLVQFVDISILFPPYRYLATVQLLSRRITSVKFMTGL